MALYAIDNLDDAIDATRGFLLPFEPWTWVKLAVVVFFIGGVGANVPGFNFSSGTGVSGPDVNGVPVEVPTELPAIPEYVVALAIVLAVLAVVLAIVFAIVGAIMEFVFYRSLSEQAVSIRRYWSETWGKGLRLFAFRLGFGILVAVVFLLIVGIVALPFAFGINGFAIAAMFLVVLPLLFLVGVGAAIVYGFTTAFVAPIMLMESVGVLEGWRRFGPTLRGAWKQYLAFAVAVLVINIALGIAAAFVVGILALLLAIPFVLVGVGLYLLFSPLGTVGIVTLAALVLAFLAIVFTVALLVQVPLVTYVRYYGLLVLGDTDSRFDLIPEQRAAIRADADV